MHREFQLTTLLALLTGNRVIIMELKEQFTLLVEL